MSLLKDREAAFEARFAHDADLKFRCEARQGRLAGLWAADLLGLSGAAADSYARDVAASAVESSGGEGLLRRLSADLGFRADEAAIRSRLAEALTEARRQVMGEV